MSGTASKRNGRRGGRPRMSDDQLARPRREGAARPPTAGNPSVYVEAPEPLDTWDQDALMLWESFTEDPAVAPYLTRNDWATVQRGVSQEQTHREAGGLRADLLRVINQSLDKVRMLAEERRQAEDAEPPADTALHKGLADRLGVLAIEAEHEMISPADLAAEVVKLGDWCVSYTWAHRERRELPPLP